LYVRVTPHQFDPVSRETYEKPAFFGLSDGTDYPAWRLGPDQISPTFELGLPNLERRNTSSQGAAD